MPRTFEIMGGGTHSLWYVRANDLLHFDTTTLQTTVVRHDVEAVLTVANERLWLLTTAGVIETDERTGATIGSPIAVADTVNLTATVGADVVWLAGQPDSSNGGSVTPYDLVSHRAVGPATRIGLPILTMTDIGTSVWVDAGGPIRIPITRDDTSTAGVDPHRDVLVFDDGYDGVLTVDLASRVASRRVITGQRAGDQPFPSIVTGNTLVVGWGEVYAAPLSTLRSQPIGRGVVIPSEQPDRVWLTPYGGQASDYRLVDLHGHVLLEGAGPPDTPYEPVAIPDGLALPDTDGITLWNVRTNDFSDRLGAAGAQPEASLGDTLAWCKRCPGDLQLTSLTTRVSRTVALPPGITGVDASHARFSPDGSLMAVAAQGDAAVMVVDIAHARVVRTVGPPVPFPTFAWNPDGRFLYLASSSSTQPTMTIRRVDLASGKSTATVVPVQGGLTAVVDGTAARILLDAPTLPPKQCPPPHVQPSGRTTPCAFHF